LAPPYYSQRAVFASPLTAFFIIRVFKFRRFNNFSGNIWPRYHYACAEIVISFATKLWRRYCFQRVRFPIRKEYFISTFEGR